MRQLATIKRIREIRDIPGKDLIGLGLIDGWQVIVQKTEFEAGGLCIFCEIDSLIPERPEFEFLRKKGFRIKTMKMAGLISQGICFPLSLLPEGPAVSEGDDVTERMGITKYEKYEKEDTSTRAARHRVIPKILKPLMRYKWFRNIMLTKKENRGFPDFVSKTDETRIQNIPIILECKDVKYSVTEKIDGQSATFALIRRPVIKWLPYWTRDEFIIASRNLRIWKERDGVNYWRVAEKYKMKEALTGLLVNCPAGSWVCIQGEQIGPGIQGNKYKRTDVEFYAFNLIFSEESRLPYRHMKIGVGMYQIPCVPQILHDFVLPDTVEEMLKLATAKSLLKPDILREGLVFRNEEKGVSFKAVSPEFLMKNDD